MSAVTWRPQALNTIATTITAKPSQRNILTSQAVRATALALPCAFALHLAFPRANLPWLAPLALAGLFAGWFSLRPRVAAGVGFLAGIVFFALDFDWFGETAGALLGPFGFVLDFGPAVVEALAFALAAAVAALAAQRLHGLWIPLAGAAGFTLAEILRSTGLLGVPLYQIGAAFVDTPLAPLAAFGGVYLLTFAVALPAAVLGAATIQADRRRALGHVLTVLIGVAAVTLLAWWAWPARIGQPRTLRVAAVQGDIRQSVKWEARSLPRAVERYTALTGTLRAFKPQFVLWPETVITTDLLLDPVLAQLPGNGELAATSAGLQQRFRRLARSLNTVIAVGTDEATLAGSFNDLIFFGPTGPESVYRKRRLVPFAEFLPGPGWLRGLPFATLISSFDAGTLGGPFDRRLGVAPLICWEAGFTELAHSQVTAGARFFAIATDDAWFGESDGPYAQVQLAQLRAIETGRWIVRAAATGISGIVAPDGRWEQRSALDTQAVITGTIGEPQPTVYSRLGPWPIALLLTLMTLSPFAFAQQRRAR